jgi:hypothetical protein
MLSFLNSFNAGELSPKLDVRTDLEKYRSGCRELKNFIATIYGGTRYRNGSRYVAPTKHADKATRLLPFRFSRNTNYVLEFGDQYIRFFANGGQVESAPSTPLEVASPYLEAELFAIQIKQINNLVYIAHPNHAPRVLTRVTDTSWTLAELDYTDSTPALLPENLDRTVTLTASAVTGSGITLTQGVSGDPIFDDDHVGAYFQISELRDDAEVELAITANGTGSSLRVQGLWTVATTGIWAADVVVQRSYDNGLTWETAARFDGASDRNVNEEFSETRDVLVRAKVENYVSHDATSFVPQVRLIAEDPYIRGLVEITAVTVGGRSATATVINRLPGTSATSYWAEGAWSDFRGNPRAVGFHEQRIFWGGTDYQAQTIWGSKPNVFNDYALGSLDTDGVAYTLVAEEYHEIQWFSSAEQLLIGTSAGVWVVGSPDATEALSPLNFFARQRSDFGNTTVEAVKLGDSVIQVEFNKQVVREIFYRGFTDEFASPDLTKLAEHITSTGITDTARQQNRYKAFWAVTEDGKLIGMTYERADNVVAWFDCPTAGADLYESVACINGEKEDQLWMVVKREVQGSTVRYVEYIDMSPATSKKEAFHMDSGLSRAESPEVTIAQVDKVIIAGTTTGSGATETAEYRYKITATAYPFSAGDFVRFENLTIFPELNGVVGKVYVDTANTFYLVDEDATWSGTGSLTAGDSQFYTTVQLTSALTSDTGGGKAYEVQKLVAGLSHLAERDVVALFDGKVAKDLTVSAGGVLTLPGYGNRIHVGLPYEGIVQPMKLEPAPGQDGGLRGRRVRPLRASIHLQDSLGGKIRTSKRDYNLTQRDGGDVMDESAPLFTGEVDSLAVAGQWDEDNTKIVQDDPLPMNLLGVLFEFKVGGPK